MQNNAPSHSNLTGMICKCILPAAFTLCLFYFEIKSACINTSRESKAVRKIIVDNHGAIIRGDLSQKQIALVLTGDEFADGGEVITKTLEKHQISASFFFTGNFYANKAFKKLIHEIKQEGHYLGAHSDKHLLYADWTKRDSLLVTEKEFKLDLKRNYKRMAHFGVSTKDAPYFLPPYEWYNATISEWTRQLKYTLVNFSPGTRSSADYTYPEMGPRYVSTQAIYDSILDLEKTDPNGLNGFILLIHIGTDPRRKDKFYHKLDALITELEKKKYTFMTITQLLKER